MKKNLIQLFIIGLIGIGFIGCGPGPMQIQGIGPLNTPVFKPVILDTVNDGSKEVYFKESVVGLYENKEFKGFGNFVITDNGVYYVRWDATAYIYTTSYQIKINDIKMLTTDKVIRSFLPDSDILVIEDKRGQKVGFSIVKKLAAKNIIYELIEKKGERKVTYE